MKLIALSKTEPLSGIAEQENALSSALYLACPIATSDCL